MYTHSVGRWIPWALSRVRVEDAALVYECLQGADPLDPTTAGQTRPRRHQRRCEERLQWASPLLIPTRFSGMTADPEVEAAVRFELLKTVIREALGAKIVELDFQ